MQVNTTPVPLNVDESRRLPKIGEYAYVKVTMGGETVEKWLCCKYICKYYNGKEVYEKDSNNTERWVEYDSRGNVIHLKESTGAEVWKEYDSNGNVIHKKISDGREFWYEYDSNGNTELSFCKN